MRRAERVSLREVGCSLAAVAVLVGTLGASGTAAEVRRVEAVGSVPVYADARPSRAPRDAAIERALLEAVSRVAGGFLLDAHVVPSEPTDPESFGLPESQAPGTGPSTPELDSGEAPVEDDPPVRAPPADYAKIFGRNLVQYTAHYRILEDRGERPALFAADATVESEYVVIVEVHVDAVRVRHRLEEVGLVAPPGAQRATRRIVLEVRGLRVYPAFEALKAVLLDPIGASRVVALEFTQDHVRLGVEYARGGPAELLDDLYANSPRELEITPVLSDDLQLTISVHWTPSELNGSDEPEGFLPGEDGEFEGFEPRPRPPVVDAAAPRSSPASPQ